MNTKLTRMNDIHYEKLVLLKRVLRIYCLFLKKYNKVEVTHDTTTNQVVIKFYKEIPIVVYDENGIPHDSVSSNYTERPYLITDLNKAIVKYKQKIRLEYKRRHKKFNPDED